MSYKVGDIVSLKIKDNEYLPLRGSHGISSMLSVISSSLYKASNKDQFLITKICPYEGIFARMNETYEVRLNKDLIKNNADIVKERLGIK